MMPSLEVIIMTTGQRIKSRRKALGMNADKLAELVGVSRSTIFRYEKGDIEKIPMDVLEPFAKALNTSVSYLMGWTENASAFANNIPSEGIAYRKTGMAPVVGTIPAGVPVLAIQNIENYEPVDVSDPENVFWLRVSGESMSGAGIHTGDLALIRMQPCAENGQIVACRVNGDEATLKRFKRQGDVIILLPENSDFEPRIINAKEFETGEAEIIGVLLEIKRKY